MDPGLRSGVGGGRPELDAFQTGTLNPGQGCEGQKQDVRPWKSDAFQVRTQDSGRGWEGTGRAQGNQIKEGKTLSRRGTKTLVSGGRGKHWKSDLWELDAFQATDSTTLIWDGRGQTGDSKSGLGRTHCRRGPTTRAKT